MRKQRSVVIGIGLLIFLAYSLTDRFITPLTDWIAIPWMIIAISLILVGLIRHAKPDV